MVFSERPNHSGWVKILRILTFKLIKLIMKIHVVKKVYALVIPVEVS